MIDLKIAINNLIAENNFVPTVSVTSLFVCLFINYLIRKILNLIKISEIRRSCTARGHFFQMVSMEFNVRFLELNFPLFFNKNSILSRSKKLYCVTTFPLFSILFIFLLVNKLCTVFWHFFQFKYKKIKLRNIVAQQFWLAFEFQ